ncbi:MAG: hypothetical protein KGI37_10340 [Alphaproteobacteria bacterium]|nr:hypothetical protein [Alphaproteobacteria bacterium]
MNRYARARAVLLPVAVLVAVSMSVTRATAAESDNAPVGYGQIESRIVAESIASHQDEADGTPAVPAPASASALSAPPPAPVDADAAASAAVDADTVDADAPVAAAAPVAVPAPVVDTAPPAVREVQLVGRVAGPGSDPQYRGYVNSQTDADLAMLDNHDYRAATQAIDRLSRNYPDSDDAQYLRRKLDAYNKAELDVNAYYNPRTMAAITGGEGAGVDATLYSAPIDYNWRVFAGSSYAHENESDAGLVDESQSRAGVEYRGASLVASVAPTYNLYRHGERAGFNASGEWSFNNAWSAGGGYQLFSRDVPLQALNAGVTANKASTNIDWKIGETREVYAEADDMAFSDGNNRLIGDVLYAQNLYDWNDWWLDGVAQTAATQDSGDEFRAYYNPKADVTEFIGPKLTEILYHRYDILYKHSLSVSPGGYWQQNYGTSPAVNIVYAQSLRWGDSFETRAAADYTHQDADGQPQNDVGFTVNMVERF